MITTYLYRCIKEYEDKYNARSEEYFERIIVKSNLRRLRRILLSRLKHVCKGCKM